MVEEPHPEHLFLPVGQVKIGEYLIQVLRDVRPPDVTENEERLQMRYASPLPVPRADETEPEVEREEGRDRKNRDQEHDHHGYYGSRNDRPERRMKLARRPGGRNCHWFGHRLGGGP